MKLSNVLAALLLASRFAVAQTADAGSDIPVQDGTVYLVEQGMEVPRQGCYMTSATCVKMAQQHTELKNELANRPSITVLAILLATAFAIGAGGGATIGYVLSRK